LGYDFPIGILLMESCIRGRFLHNPAEGIMGKRTLQYAPIVKARIRQRLRPSSPSVPTLFLLRLLAPAYIRFALKFNAVTISGMNQILAAWRDFQEKRIRLILAFRHPYGEEPQLFSYVFDILLGRESRKCGNPLPRRPHARFVHGYEVALWGSAFIRWLLPRIGAVPVYHVRIDSAGMKAIRRILRDDACPLALAPEGQVSYRSETLPRLEQGAVRMGFWCAQDMEKSGRSERVVILPLSVHYKYDQRDMKKLMAMLERDEAACGMKRAPSGSGPIALRDRLATLEDNILDMAETHYVKAYRYHPPTIETTDPMTSNAKNRRMRWECLMDAALDMAECELGIPRGVHGNESGTGSEYGHEDRISRVYRIRQHGWDRIYPVESDTENCGLTSALADRRAGEAWYAMRHMEFVDLMFYLDAAYLEDAPGNGPSFDRLVETAYNLDDLISRLSGGNFSNRSNVMRKAAFIIPGPALDISARFEDYKANWKEAAKKATADLAESYLQCVKEYLDGKND
jgi:hypothetical protein